MKTLSNVVTTVALLLVLVTLPSAVLAFRQMVNQISTSVPHFNSAVDEARFWAHTFAP